MPPEFLNKHLAAVGADDTNGPLTARDLHRLAEYAEADAAMFEAGDHRTGEEPDPWNLGHAADLRALAARARAHLGDPHPQEAPDGRP